MIASTCAGSSAIRRRPNQRCGRHLRDAATLATLITDHAAELIRLRGPDSKRLRHLRDALADPLSDTWLLRPGDAQQRGQDTLRILAG